MAKNWTIAEAMQQIVEGNDEVLSIGKSYPRVLVELVKAKDNEGAVNILTNLPENVTVRKVNDCLTNGSDVSEDEDIEDEVEEKTVKKGRATKTDEEKKAAAKARREARKAKAASVKNEDEEDESENESDDYSEMSAIELFKLCKKRGLKPKERCKASVYIDMLKKDDAKSVDDDWDEDEEDEKPVKKPSNKKSAKVEVEDDEDDDWDL